MKEKSISFEIKKINGLIARKIFSESKELSKNCISHTQIKIIIYLLNNKNKKIYQTDIEKFLMVRRSTASDILSNMEKNELIDRISSSLDARKKQIILTDKTLNISKIIIKKIKKIDFLLKENISSSDLNTFFYALEVIENNILKGEN